MPHRIILQSLNGNQDKFYLWGMVLLPILSLCAYIFDAYYYHYKSHDNRPSLYEGLLSTIMIVFSYLQYCAPIQSKFLRLAYHLFLWVLVEAGHIGYLITFIEKKDFFLVFVFVGWMICDIFYTSGLIYCRVYRQLDYHVEVENKHIFHFISRLEIILAIFIPVYLNKEYSTITRDNIAFFLLFDFFSEQYEYFHSIWIKSCLYSFVTVVTISVACEWLYFGIKQHSIESIANVAELVAASLCYVFIIMQFFRCHFKIHPQADNSRQPSITVIDIQPITSV